MSTPLPCPACGRLMILWPTGTGPRVILDDRPTRLYEWRCACGAIGATVEVPEQSDESRFREAWEQAQEGEE